MLELAIGNKNYSSWSMRPWVLMKQAGIPFAERLVRFDSFDAQSRFKREALALNPAGKVPVLIDDGFPIWDTLAIAEHLAERFPEHCLWPEDVRQRARARSVCAEMHAGFGALRSACGMNIEADLPEQGALIWRDNAGVRADIGRIVAMWDELLGAHGGPLLFGERFTIADAYFAPVCMRIHTFHLPVPPAARAYVDRVRALPGVAAWIDGALAERDFLAFEEPYRLAR